MARAARIAIAVGDVVIALENAVYSVISPEGLRRDPVADRATRRPTAALAMKMTAADQRELGVVDVVVPEPGEGAHADPDETARRLRRRSSEQLDALDGYRIDELRRGALPTLPGDGRLH